MIKLVVTDVDGTLLDSDSMLPELNRQALLDCQKRNIGVILATGKTVHAVRHHIAALKLELPQITMHGAAVLDKEFKLIHSVKIEPGLYIDVIRTIKKRGYRPLAAKLDGYIYFDSYDEKFSFFEQVDEKLYAISSLEDDSIAQNCAAISVAIRETDPLDMFLRQKYSSILQVVRSGEFFFDVLNLDANKGHALHYLCSKLKIKRDEIAVFGDSPNDLSMFDYAGLKVAVKNSYPEILQRADIITDESYNCGLAKAIYKYILV
ncbi:MAG: HAD family hydrolase [Actinobacteria bacterium]|nr:HAD family hydrolase [Actinomycetota bacterium]